MEKEPMSGMQMVLDNIRPSFEFNVSFVDSYLKGRGIDMGCGNCPLLKKPCMHIDMSPQPLAVEQVGVDSFYQFNAVNFYVDEKFDYVFSSHMVEDLPTEEAIIECLKGWSRMLRTGGFLVTLVPDMEGGRYPKVNDPSGNPSHRIDVGKEFFSKVADKLLEFGLVLIQIDTIPHDKSCTMDLVLQKVA